MPRSQRSPPIPEARPGYIAFPSDSDQSIDRDRGDSRRRHVTRNYTDVSLAENPETHPPVLHEQRVVTRDARTWGGRRGSGRGRKRNEKKERDRRKGKGWGLRHGWASIERSFRRGAHVPAPKSLIYRSRGPPLTIPRPLAAAATLIRVRACINTSGTCAQYYALMRARRVLFWPPVVTENARARACVTRTVPCIWHVYTLMLASKWIYPFLYPSHLAECLHPVFVPCLTTCHPASASRAYAYVVWSE